MKLFERIKEKLLDELASWIKAILIIIIFIVISFLFTYA